MDAEDVIYHLKNDEITVKCIKIRLLNLCQNNLIEIEDDAQRKIAYISILFLETTVEEDSPILII